MNYIILPIVCDTYAHLIFFLILLSHSEQMNTKAHAGIYPMPQGLIGIAAIFVNVEPMYMALVTCL